MITLLMALFIVMWAISSVNTTKFAELSVSLKQAFNGKLVDGGENIQAARQLMPSAARSSATPRAS
jgi:chemotaxis protein MotB